jgi:hypothetical protein
MHALEDMLLLIGAPSLVLASARRRGTTSDRVLRTGIEGTWTKCAIASVGSLARDGGGHVIAQESLAREGKITGSGRESQEKEALCGWVSHRERVAQFPARCDVELWEDPIQVELNGTVGQVEPLPDLSIGEPLGG